ncbi:MAG: hypothetical protein MJ072_00050 [Clostridia bacterium]|nr:hypothetical protein [Clostridia bacterium]
MLINYKTGKKMTDKEIKADIMATTGWTSAEYQKNYDVFRNKVRTYERNFAPGKKYKVNELLYEIERSKAKWGKGYKPSSLVRAIMATPSQSTGKTSISANVIKSQYKQVISAFRGLRKAHPEAQAILKKWQNAQRLKDPSKRPSVTDLKNDLAKFADNLRGWQKTKQDEYRKQNGDNVPAGRKVGTPS